MALGTYAELQTAIQNELRRTDLSSLVPDFIKRAESKINRLLRMRETEQVSTATYDTNVTTRRLALPSNFVELLALWIKEASAEDTDYREMRYVEPSRFNRMLESAGRPIRYTLADQIIMDRLADNDYTVRMHYLKQWDIATDSTNWLLTNYPDVYLYGSLAETEMHIKNDKRVPLWKAYFLEAIRDLNKMDERSRNDAELSTRHFDSRTYSYGYRILSDSY